MEITVKFDSGCLELAVSPASELSFQQIMEALYLAISSVTTLAIVAGTETDEFPDFAHRTAVFDEFLSEMREKWSERRATPTFDWSNDDNSFSIKLEILPESEVVS